MPPPDRVLAGFASGSTDLIETFLDELARIDSSARLAVISEFAPPRGQWIPYLPGRTVAQNLARIRDELAGAEIAWTGLILQPRMPYWKMRLAAFLLKPSRVLCFNENLNHFALRPGSALQILRHFAWRARNFIRWETRPGGWLYTQVWRLFHPWAYERPLAHFLGRLAVWTAKALKSRPASRAEAPPASDSLPRGVSVVIPSSNGRSLLAKLLPGLVRETAALTAEIIVVDNGSSDRTAEWLASEWPQVRLLSDPQPLGFAPAANRGISSARYSHTCLLNNDMVVQEGFFAALLDAFHKVPDLFCSSAQILFPAGKRREETGKTVWWLKGAPVDFPVWCPEPLEGEDLTPVLYGSGGCSLYDTAKLRALSGFDEAFAPAYVEDLDLGYRAWLRGWPSVLAAQALVIHDHRSTTSRFFTQEQIQRLVERNFLRFLACSISTPSLFAELAGRMIGRLNLLAASSEPVPSALPSLWTALRLPSWARSLPTVLDERLVLALCSGDVAHFPGHLHRDSPALLIATPYLPFPLSHGGAVRMFNLIREAAREFDIVLVSFCDQPARPAADLLDLCREIVLVTREGSHLRPLTARPDVVEEHDQPAFRAALREAIRRHDPFAVQLEFTQMGLYAADCAPTPTLLIEHDITVDLYEQLYREKPRWETARQLERWRDFEHAVWQEVSCVVTMSEKDRAAVQGARRVEVIENGVDLDRFTPAEDEPEPRRLLFIGSFAHLPNLTAIDFFLREAWPPLRDRGAILHVITGARAEHYQELYRDRVQVDLAQPGLFVEGFVSDVRPAYRKAAVVIAPLLASAGTNIKIMEAMAMGKAIVSTPAGVNGLSFDEGAEVIVARTGPEMASAIQRLFDDPAERRRIGRNARLAVEQRYGWPAIGAKQSALYRSLLIGPRQ